MFYIFIVAMVDFLFYHSELTVQTRYDAKSLEHPAEYKKNGRGK